MLALCMCAGFAVDIKMAPATTHKLPAPCY